MLFVLRDSKETGDERKINMAVEATSSVLWELRSYFDLKATIRTSSMVSLALGNIWLNLPRLVVFGGKRLATVVAKQ